MFNCFLLFFFFLQQSWRSTCLVWPGGRSRPRFLWFLRLGWKWRLVFGGHVGGGEKKKRSQESSQGRRAVLKAQRTQTFLFLSFILKYRLRGSCKTVPSSLVQSSVIFPQRLHFNIMIVQYLNEETDIGTMCVCNSMSFYHICRFLQLSLQSRSVNIPSPQRFPSCHPSIPKPWQV